jgi:hypothetical protein
MFDYIRCEVPLPDGYEAAGTEFQTKSLWCSMDRLTITPASRLIYHRRRYDNSTADQGKTGVGRFVPAGDADMDFHGDLLIRGESLVGATLNCVVRFTHGTVEWIRAFDAMSEIHRTWLLERGQ